MESTTVYRSNTFGAAAARQRKWQRIILLTVLGYEGLGAILGGLLLILRPDGRLMDMPVEIMNGVFSDFLIPGIILFGMGILNVFAFFPVLRRNNSDWVMAQVATGGMIIWFVVEIVILQALHWLHAMWGLPVLAGWLAALPLIPFRSMTRRQALLACGILSSVLYIALNIFIPMLWPAYNSASQTVSELSAVDAPTRFTWVVLSTPYTLLVTAFAWGVWKSAGSNRALRSTGILLIIYGALGLFWPFAPMHLREVIAAGGSTITDTIHLTLGGVTEVIFILALIFAAAALGKSFRIYSLVTLAVILLFGLFTFMDSPGISKNLPTPHIGTWERINIGVFLLWIVVLAVSLWPEKNSTARR